MGNEVGLKHLGEGCYQFRLQYPASQEWEVKVARKEYMEVGV